MIRKVRYFASLRGLQQSQCTWLLTFDIILSCLYQFEWILYFCNCEEILRSVIRYYTSLFMPLPPLGSAGSITFSCCPSMCGCVRLSVASKMLILLYLWSALMDFHQTLSVVHLGTKMNWLGFGVKQSRTRSQHYQMSVFRGFFQQYLGYASTNFLQTFVTSGTILCAHPF